MITNGYKLMLRNDSDIENELWNETYKELRAKKDELLNKLSLIDKADDEYYRQSDLILKFCKNSSKIFSNSSASEKRTICEVIGSNSPKRNQGNKKEPSKKALNLNGGNDEARTRDLMRDRHAL